MSKALRQNFATSLGGHADRVPIRKSAPINKLARMTDSRVGSLESSLLFRQSESHYGLTGGNRDILPSVQMHN